MAQLNGQRHGFDGSFGHPSRRSGGGVSTLRPVYEELIYATEPVIGVTWHPIDAGDDLNRSSMSHLLLVPRVAPRAIPMIQRGLIGTSSGALITINPSPFTNLDLGATAELTT